MCTVPDSASLLCNQWFSDQTEGQECTPRSTAENKASDTAFLSLPSSCVKEAVSRYVHLSTTASKWDQPPPKVGSAYNAWVSSLYWHHIGIMQTIRGIFRWSHSLPIFSHGFKEETAVKQWCWWFIYFFPFLLETWYCQNKMHQEREWAIYSVLVTSPDPWRLRSKLICLYFCNWSKERSDSTPSKQAIFSSRSSPVLHTKLAFKAVKELCVTSAGPLMCRNTATPQ